MTAGSELSLLYLYDLLTNMKSTYDEKISSLYDMYKPNDKFPDGVTNSNDGPGLWPDNGVNVYNVIDSYGLSAAFCDTGVVVNVASAQQKFQLMLVETCTTNPDRVGRLYYRYADSATGQWTAWSSLATTADLDALKGGKITVDHATRADVLTTPRKISLSGAINGSTLFSGAADVDIPTTIDGMVPINVVVSPRYYTTKSYRLLCTLPVSDGTTHDYALIAGHVGGWSTTTGKANVSIVVSNRDAAVVNGLAVGTLGPVDVIVVHNVDKSLAVYLVLDQWVGECKLSVFGSQLTLGSGQETTVAPSGSPVWTLSVDSAQINGKNSNMTTTGKAQLAGTADKSLTIHSVSSASSTGNLLAVNGDNTTPFYSNPVKLDASSGTVYANTFVGAVTGTADHALKSDVTLGISAVNNNAIKAYLVGIPDGDNTAYYDSYTYLDTSAGKLHATEFSGTTSTTVNLTTNTATVNGLMTSYGVRVTGAVPYVEFCYGNATSPTSRLVANSAGMLTCSGEFTADRIHNAIWNDYAEYFPRGGATSPGDVIVLDVSAKDESYVKSTEGAALVVGVHSDEYGHIIGGQQPPIGMSFADFNIINYIPVALAGRVHVNFVGTSTKGGRVVATNDGCARLYSDKTDSLEDVFGYLVESDSLTAKRRLRIKLK